MKNPSHSQQHFLLINKKYFYDQSFLLLMQSKTFFLQLFSSYLFKRLMLIPITMFLLICVNHMLIQNLPLSTQDQLFSVTYFSSLDQNALDSPLDHSGTNFDTLQSSTPHHLFHLDHLSILLKKYIFFDLGVSFFHSETVLSMISSKAYTSFSYTIPALFFSYFFAVLLAYYKHIGQYAYTTWVSEKFLEFISSLPLSFVAVFLLCVFSYSDSLTSLPLKTHYHSSNSTLFPFFDTIKYNILPFSLLVLPRILHLSAIAFSMFEHESQKPYAQMAVLYGACKKNIALVHLLPNIYSNLIATIPGQCIKILFSSMFVVEIIFSVEGIGSLLFQSVKLYDYPLILGIIYLQGLFSLTLYLIADFLMMALNKKIEF